MKTTTTDQKSSSGKNTVERVMTPTIKGMISVLIFGNEDFPVLPSPFQCMVHTTMNGAADYLRKNPVDIIYVGKSDACPVLSDNIIALAKTAPASSLIALAADFAEADLAISNGASDCILRDRLTIDTAIERARFVNQRARYLRHGGGNNLYSYNDLAAIARVLSHDIRNSLSGIVLSLEPLRQAVGNSEDGKAYLDILERSSGKLNQVINRFSSATGNIALRTKDEDLNDLVQQAIATLPPNYSQEAKIVSKFAPGPLTFPLDRDKFPGVVAGIIQNAFEALDGRGNGQINITTSVNDDAIVLTISDNGHGIDFTTLQNIFRPFFTTRPGHIGLGLSLAYSVVNAHGGALRIASENGTGTTVICTFPLKK
jgi:signal transduction histidine kinase